MTPFWDFLRNRSDARESFDDPRLGHMRWDKSWRGWRAASSPSDLSLVVLAQGPEPKPREVTLRVAHAHLERLADIKGRVQELIEHEITQHPELDGELRGLKLEEMVVGLQGRPEAGMLWFDSEDEEQSWRCDIKEDGTLAHLGFDH